MDNTIHNIGNILHDIHVLRHESEKIHNFLLKILITTAQSRFSRLIRTLKMFVKLRITKLLRIIYI